MPPEDSIQSAPSDSSPSSPEKEQQTQTSKALLEAAGIHRVDLTPEEMAAQSAPPPKTSEKGVSIRQTIADVTGSVGAGVSGVAVFSLVNVATKGSARALTIPLAMLAGGVTKYGVKSGVEHAILDQENHTTSKADLAWGAVDGLAGVVGSAVEQRISKQYLSALGRRALGSSISTDTALEGAQVIVKNSAFEAVKHNAVRGAAGGAAGTFVWSAPRRIGDNASEFATNPGEATFNTTVQMAQDVALGGLFGGVLSGGGTALFRGKELSGQTIAKLRGDADVMRIDGRFVGDFHSNLDQLPHMKTALEGLNKDSARRGIPTSFDITGDAISGHVNFAFTKGGQVEYESLIDMQARKIILGNHEHDAAGGLFDVPRWGKMIKPILDKNPSVSVINTNLDVSAYSEYQGLMKPYVIEEIAAPWGKTKVATIGLTTEEGAVGSIKYNDAERVAIETIRDLNSQGIKHIVLDTHIGLGEDIKLAKALIREDLKVSRIQGGHSHSITPEPIWVKPERGFLGRTIDSLTGRPSGGNFEIPIMHAGSGGRWLGDFRVAMKPDGTAHRFHTTGQLHPITPDIPADPHLSEAIKQALPERNLLRQELYGAQAIANYTARGLRERETALGNLVSDAIRDGLKKDLGDDIVVMTHSGGIRDQIVAGKELNRLDLSNLIMNAGKREGEIKELVNVQMTGDQIRQGLEYGIRDLHPAVKPSFGTRMKSLFVEKTDEVKQDLSGNFVQVSGLKYSIDLHGKPWTPTDVSSRITNLRIQNSAGEYVPIDPAQTYSVVTRQHPVHKWAKAGMFGVDKSFEQVQQELRMRKVEVSQVDLLANYIQGKNIDPKTFSNVEGRITTANEAVKPLPVRVGVSVLAQPLVRTTDTKPENR